MNRAAALRGLALALALVAAPATAYADWGDHAVGPYLSAAVPREGRVGGAVRLGLTDWLSFDARLAFAYGADGPAGLASGGLVLLYDVIAWVPELRLAGGGRVDGDGFAPRVLATVGVRHYLTRTWSLAASGGVEWTPDHWLGLATVGAWLAF